MPQPVYGCTLAFMLQPVYGSFALYIFLCRATLLNLAVFADHASPCSGCARDHPSGAKDSAQVRAAAGRPCQRTASPEHGSVVRFLMLGWELIYSGLFMRTCACLCVCVPVCLFICASVRACHARTHLHALQDQEARFHTRDGVCNVGPMHSEHP